MSMELAYIPQRELERLRALPAGRAERARVFADACSKLHPHALPCTW
jgi:hypothetical protein